jgi:hypothetical protein
MGARLEQVATWTAGAIGIGWLLTAASVAFGGGHPPAFFVVGEGVVLVSVVLAPIGVGAALVALWQARRDARPASGRVLALLGCNLLFLLTAVGLWLWIVREASRR